MLGRANGLVTWVKATPAAVADAEVQTSLEVPVLLARFLQAKEEVNGATGWAGFVCRCRSHCMLRNCISSAKV